MAGDDATLALDPLVEWAIALRWKELSSEVQRKARWVVLDDIGAMLAGSYEPESVALRELVDAESSQSTVLTRDLPCRHRHDAAALNGFAGTILELDEGYRSVPCHAGLYSLPAALATSEWLDLSMADCLEALIVGYEVATRCARAWRFEPGTLYPHGAYASIAAAAATSKLLGHEHATFIASLTSAATLAMASPFNHASEGAMVRNLWPGTGGRMGMLAAELARAGVSGLRSAPKDVFEDLLGGQPVPVVGTGGKRPAILDGFHKLYACCQYLHSAVDALLTIRREHPDRDWPAEVASIRVHTHPAALALSDSHPATTLGGKFSMPHALAAVAALGTGSIRAFTQEALHDSAIVGLRDLVSVEPLDERSADGGERASRVEVQFMGGQQVDHFCLLAPGEPGRPFDEATLIDKFVEMAARQLPMDKGRQVGSHLLNCPSHMRVRTLVGLLAETPPSVRQSTYCS